MFRVKSILTIKKRQPDKYADIFCNKGGNHVQFVQGLRSLLRELMIRVIWLDSCKID